jgi:hypothetical protein
MQLTLPQPAKTMEFVDQTTKEQPPQTRQVNSQTIRLAGFEVSVVTF